MTVRRTAMILTLATLSLGLSSCGGGRSEEPTLRVDDNPAANAMSIQFIAEGVDWCPGTDAARVEDVEVEESADEVVVSAAVEIDDGFGLGLCEVRTVRERFDVALEQPLGDRVVVDDSRGDHSIIWSPRMRERRKQSAELTEADAMAFVRSRFDVGAKFRCARVGPYFECRYLRDGVRQRVILRVWPGGKLSVFDKPTRDPVG